MNEEEIWKPVEGYEGIYEISSLGRVKRLEREVLYKNGVNYKYGEMLLSPVIKSGKPFIGFFGETHQICNLVAKHFIGKHPGSDYEVIHKDGDKLNVKSSNIEYRRVPGTEGAIWKDVIGFEGLYEVSSTGLVRSKNKPNATNPSITNFLSNSCDVVGYLTVTLYNNEQNLRKTFKVHRLVSEAFIPNPQNKPHVNHKDLKRSNNNVENLEWVTFKENLDHSVLMQPEKHKKCGSDNGNYRGDIHIYKDGELKYIARGRDELEKLNFSSKSVYSIIDRDKKSHKGYTFKRPKVLTKKIVAYAGDEPSLVFKTLKEAGNFGFNGSGISKQVNGRLKTYKGFKFKYEQE